MSVIVLLTLTSIFFIFLSFVMLITKWHQSTWFNLSFLLLLSFMLLFFISNFLKWQQRIVFLDPYESFMLPMVWSFFIFSILINLKIIDLENIQIELKLSNRNFQLVTETIQDMFWLESPKNNKSMFVSSGYSSVFNRSFEPESNNPSYAHHWITAIAPQDRENYLHQINQKIADGQPYTLEYKIYNEFGNPDWILEKGYPVKNEKGEIDIVAGVCTNITGRKLTELALKKSEERLRLILSSIGDAVIITDTEGKIEWINKIAEKLTGWSSNQAQGQIITEVFQIFNVEKEGNRKALKNPVDTVLSAGKIVELGTDAILMNRNGTQYHIADSTAPIKDDLGNIHGVIIAFTDVTANYTLQQQLIENKERLELAISVGQLGTWDWDIKNGKATYNHWWASMLGYAIDEIDPQYSFWQNLVHPDDLPRVLKNRDDHFKGSAQLIESEYRLHAKSGNWVWVHSKGKVIARDTDGQPVRACGIQFDITNMKNYQKQLELQKEHLGAMNDKLLTANKDLDQANTHLKELDLLKNDFISIASHELRTPVTTVLGFAQTLLTPGLSINESKRNEYLKIIEKEATRLGKLINDLLNISAIESEHAMMDMKCQSIDEIAREAIDSMKPSQEQSLLLVNDNRKKLQVYCNSDQINQVFIIIMENALRYGNKVIVKLEENTSDIQVSIHDNGPGIASQYLKIIFEKFYRIQGEQKPGKGSGLGLAIAKDIIVAHGGNIWVESSPGKGSTFYFTLKKC